MKNTLKSNFEKQQVIQFRKDFQVGDIVKINHKKVDSESRFTIIKINKKSIRIQNKNNVFHTIKLSPRLLELV